MPKTLYKESRISADKMLVIDQANTIIREYQADGLNLTLRQLYYQFVQKDAFPKDWPRDESGSQNIMKNYKKLGEIIVTGGLAGLIDWEAITDRTRNFEKRGEWDNPADIIEQCSRSFRIDRWADQMYRPEVWIEKDALVGVVERICHTNGVGYFSCRGYTSISEVWSAAQRLVEFIVKGQRPVILHFGDHDHDPSGVDMTRDIISRLLLFVLNDLARDHACGSAFDLDKVDPKDSKTWPFEVRRMALNMAQVLEYNPPPNPAKITDSRAAKYIDKFGRNSWELDALDPRTIVGLIEKELRTLRDIKNWNRSGEREEEHRAELKLISDEWESAPIQKILKRARGE